MDSQSPVEELALLVPRSWGESACVRQLKKYWIKRLLLACLFVLAVVVVPAVVFSTPSSTGAHDSLQQFVSYQIHHQEGTLSKVKSVLSWILVSMLFVGCRATAMNDRHLTVERLRRIHSGFAEDGDTEGASDDFVERMKEVRIEDLADGREEQAGRLLTLRMVPRAVFSLGIVLSILSALVLGIFAKPILSGYPSVVILVLGEYSLGLLVLGLFLVEMYRMRSERLLRYAVIHLERTGE